MNIKFSGEFTINVKTNRPKGYSSEAAKAAFKDILSDPDMRVHCESFSCDIEGKINCILTEDILDTD